MSTGRDDHGVQDDVRKSVLGTLLEQPETFVLRHFKKWGAKKSLCGATEGITVTDPLQGLTCAECRAVLDARAASRQRFTGSRRRGW